ncbi:MAG: hypothetical protein ACRDQI_19725 [Pseudonocardiaceae bacterium]
MRVSAIFSQGGGHHGHGDDCDRRCDYDGNDHFNRRRYYYNGYNDCHDGDYFYYSGDGGGILDIF